MIRPVCAGALRSRCPSYICRSRNERLLMCVGTEVLARTSRIARDRARPCNSNSVRTEFALGRFK